MARKREKKAYLEEFHVRNNSVERQERYAQLSKIYPGLTKNALLLKCLDIGINSLLDDSQPTDILIKQIVIDTEKRLLDSIKAESKKIIDNTKTISIMLKISEQMESTLLQSFLYFMKTQGVDLPDAALERFRLELPNVFEKAKAEYLSKFFK